MSFTKYFSLTASDNSLSKKFRVLMSGYNPTKTKKGSDKTTLDGEWDITQGGVYQRHEYVVRVHGTDPEESDGYGSLDDLDTFFSYNEPNPVSGPSNILTMLDHRGNYWHVTMPADFTPQILGCAPEGVNSLYTVKVTFLFLEPVEGPS